MKFLVVWEVWYTDEDIKYHASEYEESENLEELIEYLDSGVLSFLGNFCPVWDFT